MNENEQYLTPAERLKKIMDRVKNDKFVDVKSLSKDFFINEATIRRDLNKLENSGLINRTYGGAVLVEGLDSEIPLYARESSNAGKKEVIGKLAANKIHDDDTIILDSSSTTLKIINHLIGKKNLKIITNGAKTTTLLSKLTDCTIYCTGGKLRENSLSFIGQTAVDYIKNFYVDIAFLSCRSLSADKGLTDSNEDEAMLRRAMISSAKKSILLIDSTKINTVSFFSICQINKIDKIICDIVLPQEITDKLRRNSFIT